MSRTSNTEERREQIVRALERVMARRGYDGASIAEVAREAGLTAGLVHYHFENKLEILLALLARLGAEHDVRLERALAPAGGDPAEELRRFIDAHLALGPAADPEALAVWVMLSGEALREPAVREGYARLLSGLTERLVAILRAGVDRGCFVCADPAAAAACVLATIQGYYLLGATARELVPRGTAAATTRAVAAALTTERPLPRGGAR